MTLIARLTSSRTQTVVFWIIIGLMLLVVGLLILLLAVVVYMWLM